MCSQCGKRKVVVSIKGRKPKKLPAKMHHDCCRQCWTRFIEQARSA